MIICIQLFAYIQEKTNFQNIVEKNLRYTKWNSLPKPSHNSSLVPVSSWY